MLQELENIEKQKNSLRSNVISRADSVNSISGRKFVVPTLSDPSVHYEKHVKKNSPRSQSKFNTKNMVILYINIVLIAETSKQLSG